MRRAVLYSLAVLFISLTTLLFLSAHKKWKGYQRINEGISSLPAFSFTTLSGESFSSSEIEKGPLLIVRFHPECEHCHFEVSSLLRCVDIPSEALIVLVSSARRDSITNFLNQYDYSGNSSIIILVDTLYAFGSIFGSEAVPSNFLYDKNLKLEKVYHGEVKTETLMKHLAGVE